MTALAATSAGSPLWYITRATGVMALILLTLTVALGVANFRRLRRGWLPRFVLDTVHRNAALLSVTFLFAHIATTVLDGYVPIRWFDAVIPFGSGYKPLAVGLGAVAFDLLIAVLMTSLMRRRLGYRAWRATHWLAYGSWPVAMLHGLTAGTDASRRWMLAISGVCALIVLGAVAARLAATAEDDPAGSPPATRFPRSRQAGVLPLTAGHPGGSR